MSGCEIRGPDADGFIKDQEDAAHLPEAGPAETRLGKKLRDLKITLSENLLSGYDWAVEEHSSTGTAIAVAFGHSKSPAFDVALAQATQALLALGATNEDGPRVGDMPRRELRPAGAFMRGASMQ